MIFVINGEPNSGKDTFVEFVDKHTSKKVVNLSSIDLIRRATRELKRTGDRKFMCELKKFMDYYCDHSFQYLKEKLAKADYDIAFVHIREAENIARFKESYLGCKTILVNRLDYEDTKIFWAQSDYQVHDYKDYDITITVKTLDDLRNEAKKLVSRL